MRSRGRWWSPSKIQLKTIEKIREAGGTAAIVVWPEQAIEEVENYEKEKMKE